MTAWELTYRGYEPDEERLREALCTTGDGYLATRGAAPEHAAGPCHYPGTCIAGAYNRLRTEIAGREIQNESLVNMAPRRRGGVRTDWAEPLGILTARRSISASGWRGTIGPGRGGSAARR